MTVSGIIEAAVIGIVVGWIASKVVTGKGAGLVWDLVLGIVGSWVGYALAKFLNLGPTTHTVVSFVFAVIGAIIILLLGRSVIRRNRAL